MAEHGPDLSMPDLRCVIATDCPFDGWTAKAVARFAV